MVTPTLPEGGIGLGLRLGFRPSWAALLGRVVDGFDPFMLRHGSHGPLLHQAELADVVAVDAAFRRVLSAPKSPPITLPTLPRGWGTPIWPPTPRSFSRAEIRAAVEYIRSETTASLKEIKLAHPEN